MALPSPTPADDWSAEILDEVRGEFNGVVSVLDPNTLTRTPYDPETDSGGESTPLVLIAPRSAIIQHIGAPSDATSAGQWGERRRYRFKFEIHDGDPVLRPGLQVRVHDGGKDPSLEAYRYTTTGVSNSSHAPLRTIEALTEQGAVGGA